MKRSRKYQMRRFVLVTCFYIFVPNIFESPNDFVKFKFLTVFVTFEF